jgi:hypothetical protein
MTALRFTRLDCDRLALRLKDNFQSNAWLKAEESGKTIHHFNNQGAYSFARVVHGAARYRLVFGMVGRPMIEGTVSVTSGRHMEQRAPS